MILMYHSFNFKTKSPLEEVISKLHKIIDTEFLADKNTYKTYRGFLTQNGFEIIRWWSRRGSVRVIFFGKFKEGGDISITARYAYWGYLGLLFFIILFTKEAVVRFFSPSGQYWFFHLTIVFFVWFAAFVQLRAEVIQFKLLLERLFRTDEQPADAAGVFIKPVEISQPNAESGFAELLYKFKFLGVYRFDVEVPLSVENTSHLMKENISLSGADKKHPNFAGYVESHHFWIRSRNWSKQKISGSIEPAPKGSVVHFLLKESVDSITIFPLIVIAAAIVTFLYLGEITITPVFFFLLILGLMRGVLYLLFLQETNCLRREITQLLLL